MSPRSAAHILCAAFLSLVATSCLEPPPPRTPLEAVQRMTPEEKVKVVEEALQASITDPAAVQPSEIDWQLELAEMKGVLRPTDAELFVLELAFDDRDAEIGQWMKTEKYARMLALEQQLVEAERAKDQKSTEEVLRELQPLRDEMKQLVEKHRTRILETLSENHRQKWHAHCLTERMRMLMSPLRLTDEQITELRSRAWNTVEQASTSIEATNVRSVAFANLEEEMEKDVLRRDQRLTYQAVKENNPARSDF